VAISRALDDLEETILVPERKVLYQFSARGHDVTQVLLGQLLTGARDALGGYYRSRPLLLTLGLTIEEALASTMMRVGSMSEGRDIGVVFNLPRRDGPCALPVCGGVGTQYTPAVGWAQALRYRAEVLGDTHCAAASQSRMGAMRPRRPTASGPRSTSRPRSSCRCSSSSRTTATASRCRPRCRLRAATLHTTSAPFAGSRCSTATVRIPGPRWS
jgi:hypothetical protein